MSLVRDKVGAAVARVRAALPDQNGMTDEELALNLVTYREIIGRNFLPWMNYVFTGLTSPVARAICRENALCELAEDHPRMLSNMVDGIDQKVSEARASMVLHRSTALVKEVRHRCVTSPCEGLAVMATLENASLDFVPWLRAAAVRLGSTDLTYADKHGEADVLHADAFVGALESELELCSIATPEQCRGFREAANLLGFIFQAHKNRWWR